MENLDIVTVCVIICCFQPNVAKWAAGTLRVNRPRRQRLESDEIEDTAS